MATSNFYLYNKDSKKPTPIILHFRYPNGKLTFSTRQKVEPRLWSTAKQRVKRTEEVPFQSIDSVLDILAAGVIRIHNQILIEGDEPDNHLIAGKLKDLLNIKREKDVDLQLSKSILELTEMWIADSESGKRLKKDGTAITEGTLKGYRTLRLHLEKFLKSSSFHLSFTISDNRSSDAKIKKIWMDFYNDFKEYLYDRCGNFDNGVGSKIKNIRVMLAYARECGYNVSEYYKAFHKPNEKIPVIALSPQQLSYLIYDKKLNDTLSPKLNRIKDIFVFGCTVGLRVSDLLSLTEDNIEYDDDNIFIRVRAKKNGRESIMKLPYYAIKILDKYRNKYQTLLPKISDVKLNKYLKELGQQCSFNGDIEIKRRRKGKLQMKRAEDGRSFTLADVITTHTMRRTAISTMLRAGVPERIVRTISGHSPESQSFARYVEVSKADVNNEIQRFEEFLR